MAEQREKKWWLVDRKKWMVGWIKNRGMVEWKVNYV